MEYEAKARSKYADTFKINTGRLSASTRFMSFKGVNAISEGRYPMPAGFSMPRVTWMRAMLEFQKWTDVIRFVPLCPAFSVLRNGAKSFVNDLQRYSVNIALSIFSRGSGDATDFFLRTVAILFSKINLLTYLSRVYPWKYFALLMENPPQIDRPRKIVCNEDRETCNVAV